METSKVAYITGGSLGIGYSVAESLLNAGYRVAVTSRAHERAEKAANQLDPTGEMAMGIASDVRSFDDETDAVKAVIDKWGRIDVLVANAGVGHFGSIESLTPEQWSEVIDINLTGAFNSVKACVPALKESKGYIITIASLAGTNFFAGGSAYNASKFGLVGFTQAVMLDLRDYGIKTTTIMPGSVATHFNNRTPGDADAWKIQPEDIGQMVVDLVKMPARTLPSKVEVRPSMPPKRG